MFNTILHYVMSGWEIWSSLFAPLPYGDPFLAMVVPILMFIFGTKWLIEFNVSGV